MTATDTPSTAQSTTAPSPAPHTCAPVGSGVASLRAGEVQLLACFAATQRRGPLRAARVSVSEGSTVLVAGVDAQRSLFVEPHLLAGPIAADQAWAVMQDLFKLALVARTHPGSRAVLLLAGEPAAVAARRFLTRAPGLAVVEAAVVGTPTA